MPVYEYECDNGHRSEVIHGIEAPGPERCPVCGAPLHKLLARPAIVFKGSGWAKTDRQTAVARAATAEAPSRAGAAKGEAAAEDGAGTASATEAAAPGRPPATQATGGPAAAAGPSRGHEPPVAGAGGGASSTGGSTPPAERP